MLDQTTAPGLDERYTTAITASNLKVEGDRTGAERVCIKCTGVVFTKTGCASCRKIYLANWRKTNAEKIIADGITYRSENAAEIKRKKAIWYASSADRINHEKSVERKLDPEKFRSVQRAAYIRNKEKCLARTKNYYQNNREKVRIIQNAWLKRNLVSARASVAAWAAANPEKVKESKKAWDLRNPESRRIRDHLRRARKNTSTGRLTVGIVKKLFQLQKGKCPCCKKPLGTKFHMDHIIALSRGGANTDENIQLMRATCNIKKGAKNPVDFMQSRGFLL